jgi:hypothetical protein
MFDFGDFWCSLYFTMKHKTFSIRIPQYLYDLLEAEALSETRNRNKQIIYILKEHYSTHAPPMKTLTSQSHTAVAKNSNRKTKAEVN